MNAAILNGIPVKRQVLPLPRTINAGPEVGSPVQEIEEIPGGLVVTTRETATADDLAAFMGKWMKTGAEIQKVAPNVVGNFPFDEVAAGMVQGAMIGTSIPGIGTAIGAIIGGISAAVPWLLAQFGPGPSRWENAGPNVHWWFTHYGPQAYLDWLDAQEMTPFGSVADCAKVLVYWHLQTNGKVLWYGGHSTVVTGTNDDYYVYNAQFGVDFTESPQTWDQSFFAVEKMYADLGIDWRATVALYNSTGMATGIVYLKRAIYNDAGQLVNDGTDGETPSTNTAAAVGITAALVGLIALPKLQNS